MDNPIYNDFILSTGLCRIFMDKHCMLISFILVNSIPGNSLSPQLLMLFSAITLQRYQENLPAHNRLLIFSEMMHMNRSPIIPIADKFFYPIIVSAGSFNQQLLDGLMIVFVNIALNDSIAPLWLSSHNCCYHELIPVSRKFSAAVAHTDTRTFPVCCFVNRIHHILAPHSSI